MIVDYIESYRDRFGVEPICTVLSEHGCVIAPSTYYERRRRPVTPAELEEAYLVNALADLHRGNWGVYGVRKLWHAARRAGHDVGRDQVGRLMGIAGIEGAVRGRHRTRTTQRDDTAARHPDLVKRGWNAPTDADQLWVADFSYVWTLSGFCYVAFVVDVFSRRILGWRVSTSRQAVLVLDAFRQSIDVRGQGHVAYHLSDHRLAARLAARWGRPGVPLAGRKSQSRGSRLPRRQRSLFAIARSATFVEFSRGPACIRRITDPRRQAHVQGSQILINRRAP